MYETLFAVNAKPSSASKILYAGTKSTSEQFT